MIRGSLLALLGLVSFVAVYAALGPRDRADTDAPALAASGLSAFTQDSGEPEHTTSIDAVDGSAPVTFELRPSTGAHASLDGDLAAANAVAANVRDVTPPDMTAGPQVSGPLTRVEAPAADTETEAEPQARTELLYNPIVIAAGTIEVEGRDVRLADISAPDFEARCGEGAKAWPCGRMARAALRRLIRGRAIECDVPAGADDVPDPAICRVGGEDIGAWLVAQGWAKRDGDRYEEEEDAAREAQLGLWSEARPDAQADVAASG